MMKKLLLLLLLITLTFHSTFAQDKSIYYQARNLHDNLAVGAITPTISIDAAMAADLQDLFPLGTPTSIAASLNTNPFLAGKVNFITGGAAGIGGLNSAIGAMGSLDVTNVANAVAGLMIDRAKQELTLAFFNRLEAFSKKHPEFQTLFPKTSDQLRTLLSVNYPQMLPVLREAFFADLQQITYHLEAVLELPKYKTLLNNFPEINMAIQILKLVHKLENGQTPDQIIANVDVAVTSIASHPNYANASRGFKNLTTTVHFAAILSQSLKKNDTTSIWITVDDAEDLINDEVMTRLFFALMWQRISNDNLRYYLNADAPATATNLKDLLSNNKDNILLLQNKISEFIKLSANVQEAYNKIKTKGSKPTPEEYYNFINTSLDAIDFTLSAVKLFDKDLQADEYMAIARKSNSLYKAVYSKLYTQAVSDAIDILNSVQKLTKYNEARAAAVTTAPNSPDYKESSESLTTFVTKVKPFALFIGNVAEAKSEADIKAALDNAILPVGSSSIKKNSAGNLCIQSYLGAYWSTNNETPDAARAWSDKFGVYGPIGLAYTPGFASLGKRGAFSLFASVFDLGAIIDYKLKNDTDTQTSTDPASESATSKQYSINLGQIFSPGVHIVYGFGGNIPLSLGFGAQYGPGLSKINGNGVTDVINPSWRFNIFLGVDLPFFNIVNKSRTTE